MPAIFNGTSSKVTFTGPEDVTGLPLTIVFRVYLAALPAAAAYFFHTGPGGAFRNYFSIAPSGLFGGVRTTSATASGVQSSVGLAVGRWYHVSIRHNGLIGASSQWSCTVDAVVDASAVKTDGTGTETANGSVWTIGARDYDNNRTINGKMHKFKVYKRYLSDAEIEADHRNQTVDSTGLVIDFPYDADLNEAAGRVTPTNTDISLTNVYPQPGLQAWFRADTVTGNPISAMADRSGNGADLAQATAGNRPALYSGSDWPTALVQNIDYDEQTDTELHTCLDCATGTGPIFNSRNLTVFMVAGSALTGNTNAPINEQTLFSIGDPATGSTGIVDFSITPPGDIAIRRTKASTQTLASTVYMTCNPRVYAVRCNATNVKLFNELRSETLTALTADTATGIRVGATPGTIDNAWMGDWAEMLFYSKDMSDAEVQAEIARLQTVYGLTTPNKTLIIEGSSSACGVRSTALRGFVRPLYTYDSGLLVHDDATGGHTFTNFDAEIGNLAAIAGANDLPTYILGWVGANDLSSGGDNGAAIHTQLTDWLAAIRADATIAPLLRGFIITTILVSGANTTRESSRLTYNGLIRTTPGIRVADFASIAGFVPAGNTVGDLGTICSGPLYADVAHLNDDGYAALEGTVQATLRQSFSSRTPSIPVILVALGMV